MELSSEVVASMKSEIDDRPVDVETGARVPAVPLDRRLVKLALKQLLDNALKYSPPDTAGGDPRSRTATRR